MAKEPYFFDVLTLFPDMVLDAVRHSVLGRAVESGLVVVRAWDIREHAHDRHRTVDDVPYGGGPGMVMKVGPVAECLESVKEAAPDGVESILMSAAGKLFDQSVAAELAAGKGVILVCGHYEGVDERIVEGFVDREMSVGNFVLSGGEIPALVVIDTVARLLPGVLGNMESLARESHQDGLLEHPQYTRPAEYRGIGVPEVLLSGNHAEIEEFRHVKALEKTRANRPDLYRKICGAVDPESTTVPASLGRPMEDDADGE